MARRLTLATTIHNRSQVVERRRSYASEKDARQAFARAVENGRSQGFRRTPGRAPAGAIDVAHLSPVDRRRSAKITVVLRDDN